tara:strand:- start:517 stop:831 length:315 start_codon:yes stop_codon:yes gene_type:complete
MGNDEKKVNLKFCLLYTNVAVYPVGLFPFQYAAKSTGLRIEFGIVNVKTKPLSLVAITLLLELNNGKTFGTLNSLTDMIACIFNGTLIGVANSKLYVLLIFVPS